MGRENALSKLIAKYVEDDDPQAALDAVAQINFDLMKEYSDGVPAGVMFAASTAANERIAMMLAGMVVTTAQVVHDWDEEVTAQQESLTRALVQLITADAMRDTLIALRPEKKETE